MKKEMVGRPSIMTHLVQNECRRFIISEVQCEFLFLFVNVEYKEQSKLHIYQISLRSLRCLVFRGPGYRSGGRFDSRHYQKKK
jgi:hypothetical protein